MLLAAITWRYRRQRNSRLFQWRTSSTQAVARKALFQSATPSSLQSLERSGRRPRESLLFNLQLQAACNLWSDLAGGQRVPSSLVRILEGELEIFFGPKDSLSFDCESRDFFCENVVSKFYIIFYYFNFNYFTFNHRWFVLLHCPNGQSTIWPNDHVFHTDIPFFDG